MAISADQIATYTHLDEATAGRVLKVARELVTLCGAATAPESVTDEAVIRVCAYLGTHSASGARTEAIEDLRTTWITSTRDPLRASGAESLLARYKRRRCSRVPLEATE